MAFYLIRRRRERRPLVRLLSSGSPTQSKAMPVPMTEAPRKDGWAARLLRHLHWVIGIKLLLIYLLFSLFFSSSHRPSIDAARVSDRLQLTR